MIDAASNVFMAKAHLSLIKPIVEGYMQKILDQQEWHVAEKYRDKFPLRITNHRSDFMMSEADFARYYQLCDEERQKAGLAILKEGHCPLSDARQTLFLAETALIDVMAPTTEITSQQLNQANIEHRQEYIELTLRLLAPFVPKSPLPQPK